MTSEDSRPPIQKPTSFQRKVAGVLMMMNKARISVHLSFDQNLP